MVKNYGKAKSSCQKRNNWEHITELPESNNGVATVEEIDIPEGYTTK